MSRALHSKAELHAAIDAMPDKYVKDGVIVVSPKAETRYRRGKPRTYFRRQCDKDIADRLDTQWDRFITSFVNKGIALDNLCAVLERVTDDELKQWTDHE